MLFCVRLGNNTNVSWKKASRFWMVGLGATSKLPWRYNHALVNDQCLWWVFCLYRLVILLNRGLVIRILCMTCLGMWFLLLFIYVTMQHMNFEEHILKMEFLHHSKHPQLHYKTHLVHTVRKNNNFFSQKHSK